jgi:hypothetical protein
LRQSVYAVGAAIPLLALTISAAPNLISCSMVGLPVPDAPTTANDRRRKRSRPEGGGETASNRIAAAFRGYFSPERVKHTGPAPASEDFGCFGTAWHVPSVFWFVGGNDPEIYAKAKAAGKLNELPVNHSPKFAPVLHPTMETGVEALVVGALAWLGAS